MPVAASPAPKNRIFCSASLPPVTRSADRMPASATAAVPWMSSLKRADAVAVLLQQPERVVVGEVLELDDHPGEDLLRRRDELVDQLVVRGAGDALLVQADVERIGEQLLVVGAHVEHDRQALRRVDAGAGGVERELADRDAHAVGAEVAQPEDALAVGDDDHRDVAVRPVAQDVGDAAPVVRADEQPARALEDVAELLAGEADRRRVDDRHHLVRIVDHDPEEQRLVAVVQRREVDELLEAGRLAAEVLEDPRHLLLLREHVRGQQAADAQRVALGLGERHALVQRRLAQQRGAPGKPRGNARARRALLGLAHILLSLGCRGMGLRARRARLSSPYARQIVSGTILIAPQGHSATQMPQPLQ